MFSRFISFAINKNVQLQQPVFRVYPSNFFSSLPAHLNNKDPNLVDDITPAGPVSGITDADDRMNVVKSSATPQSSTSERGRNDGDMTSFAADMAKQGVVKAMETGLGIGEMAKKTLDNVWDVTKDTTHMVKDAVAGEPEKKNDVPPTDRFVDDLRKRAGGYDLKNK